MKRRDYRHSRVRPRGAEYTLFLAAVLLSLSIARIPAQSPENQCDSQWRVVKAVDVADQDGDFDALNAVAAVSSTDVWAVGQWERFASKHSYNQPLIEHWNGKSWIRVPSPKPRLPIAQLNGVSALSSNDVWAVGYQEGLLGSPYYGYWSLIEHWDGNQWTIVDDASQVGYLTSVCAIAPDDVWAVGSTNYIGYGILSHWNGKTWSRTYIFDAIFLRSVTAINGHDVWAVGQQAHNGSGDYSYAVHFDGRKWSEVPTPSPLHKYLVDQNWLTSVTALATDDVWAVGLTRDIDTGIPDRVLTEHWDGKEWKVVPTPRLDPNRNHDLWGVVAVAPNDVWAVGSNGIDFVGPPLIEHWDGTRWSEIAAASVPAAGFLGVTSVNSTMELWATGFHTKHNSYLGTLVEHYCARQ